jgi:hypothetical protein
MRRLLVLVVAICALGGAQAACSQGQSAESQPTPGARGRTSAPVPATPTSGATAAPLPTAVRMLTTNPTDVVLRPGDPPSGFHLSAEYPTQGIEMGRLRGDTDSLRPTGGRVIGHHAVLVRVGGPDLDGVVSVATTALRYETTTEAAAVFNRDVAAAVSALAFATEFRDPTLGDESRTWRYRVGGVVVDEVVFRTRNYLLGVILVQDTAAAEASTMLRYARMLHSKIAK